MSISDSEGSTYDEDRLNVGNLDDAKPDDSIDFYLYQHINAKPSQAQGALKSFTPKEDGNELYASEKSDYDISVQRLLWVDGYERHEIHRPVQGPGTEIKTEVKVDLVDSTLIVLKILLASRNADHKFKWVRASLRFDDARPGKKEHPEIQAWAPFREAARWNETASQREQTSSVQAGFNAGYSGAEATIGASRESKISWDKTHFDEGQSYEMINDNRRNGISWFVKQNNLQDQGVVREIWVSVLLSRPVRAAPYLVNFDIYAHSGTGDEFEHKIKKFFGLRPGQTKTFSVTPHKNIICNHEGEEIIKCIDLGDLGKLRGNTPGTSSSLLVEWGPKLPGGKDAFSAEKDGTSVEGVVGHQQMRPSFPSEDPYSAHARIVGLESRIAQIESRLASQDSVILRLERKLMAKDAQPAD